MIGNGNSDKRELVVRERSGISEGRPLPAFDAEPAPAEEYISLTAYWHILRKRAWTIITCTVVLTTIATIVTFRMTPIYRATARIEVEAQTPLVQSLNDLYQKIDADDAFLQTQIQVLKSENLAWRTIEQLRLAQNADFVDGKDYARLDPEKRKVQLIAEFKDSLRVELTPKTRMLGVSFDNRSSQLAARIATTLVENYLDYNFRQKYDATRQASGWMEQQLDELKARVEQSQQALVEYERRNQIVNTSEKQNVLEQMLSDLSRDLTTARSDRIQKESLYRQILADRSHMAMLVHNELLQKLEEKQADIKGQYAEALAQTGPRFPKTTRLQQQLADVQAQIALEQDRVIERIRNDYGAAMNRERLALSAVERQKEEVGRLNLLLVQHNMLQREFESNQQLYQNLLQRLKDATVSAGLRSTNLHVVDAALPPSEPVRPKRLLNIAIGFLAGTLLGIMGAFAGEGLDHSIKSAEEVEALLAAPALAVVPLERTSRMAQHGLLRRGNGTELANTDSLGMTMIERPKSSIAEAFRALRTSILLSLAPNPPRTLLITSAQAGDGKTITAINLAQAFAQRKGPVVIVDCDLRKSGVAKALGVHNRKGVSTVLTGGNSVGDALQQYPAQPQLWVLPSGPIPPNPAELLASEKMASLIQELAARFEFVVIDSPPVLAVTDATILSSLAEGVVLVAASGATSRGGLVRTRRVIDSAGGRILGVALNKLDLRHQGYYGSYGRYYYGGYYSKYPYGNNGSAS